MAREDGRDLDGRKRTILHAVILEYVGGAEPVGSELLTQKYELGVRSATVRNELAEMSELGYLEQPHTSAGRIPSDLGYRYYVDHLVVDKAVDEAMRQEIQRHTHDGETLQGLLTDTVRVLSRMTHLLGVATTVRGLDVTVRTVMVSAMGPTQALLVLALSNGHIENRMVECPAGLTLDDLGRANEVLTATFVGRSLKQATRVKMPAIPGYPLAERMLQPVVGQVRAITRDLTRGKVITDGEEYMLAQPEFRSDIRGLADMLDEIVSSDVLYESVAPGERAQPVVIGKENRHPQMWRFSIVRNSFYVGEHEAGVVALVGPTRQAYESGIPLVNYTAQLLSTSLTRYFAQTGP